MIFKIVDYLSIFPQVKYFAHSELRIVSSAQIAILNFIRETIEVEIKEMDQVRILTHSRVNGTFRGSLILLDDS